MQWIDHKNFCTVICREGEANESGFSSILIFSFSHFSLFAPFLLFKHRRSIEICELSSVMGEIRSLKSVWLQLWCIKFQASISITALLLQMGNILQLLLSKQNTIYYTHKLIATAAKTRSKKSSDMRKVKAMSYFKLISYDQCQKTIICEMMFMPWSNAIISSAIEFGKSGRKLFPLVYWCS